MPKPQIMSVQQRNCYMRMHSKSCAFKNHDWIDLQNLGINSDSQWCPFYDPYLHKFKSRHTDVIDLPSNQCVKYIEYCQKLIKWQETACVADKQR